MHAIPLLLAALLAGAPAPLPPPWDGPPLSGDPAAMARAAAALPRPDGSDVDVLLEEGTYAFDARGRCTTTQRLVYRALTQAAAESWAETSATWAPWHQARPEIHARVVTPDGAPHALDPSTLAEGTADRSGDEMYTDVRVLRGPLPALAAGVVVEEVATVRDAAPFFDAGTVHQFYVARPHARTVRLRLEAPAALPLRWAARNLEGRPKETVADGRRVLEWTWSPSPPPAKREPWSPPERSATPQIAFSTGASWNAVAARYADVVDAQLAGASLAETARAIAGDAPTREEAAQRILDWVSSRVRYTGLELGEAALVPVPPAETLKRHYGDCKDLSLLVAGLLRALGHPATLALLRTDWDELPAELPGLGEFDHAIVHVPGPRPLWIDPTDPSTPVGSLPSWDQGRLALVAARGTAALVRTPEAGPAENRIAVSREIALQDDGWARAAEVRELRGSAASDLRRARRGAESEDAKRSDERSALERLAAKKLLAASWDGLERPDAPVRVRLEAEESRWGLTRSNDAEAAVSPRVLFSCLPSALTARADTQAADDDERGGDADEEEPAPRKAEMVLPQACSGEVRYRVVPPPGFRPRPLPERRARAVGPASFEATYSADPAGAVTVLYRAEVPRRRLSPREADALRDGIAEVAVEEKIGFERTSTALLEAGRGRDALGEIARLASGEPRAAAHRIRLALALLRLGMGEAARKEARRAVELEPGSGWARRVLAHVLAHDLIGRFMRPGCDLQGAVAAQRKAATLDGGSAQTRAQLAFYLLHGARCERGASGARPDEALAIYAAIREDGTKDHDEEYLRALLGARRFREAVALARDMEKGAARSSGLVAALAATEGPDAAAREAARLSPADRFAALQAATLQLVTARQYAAAARLVDVASGGAANAAQLQAAAAVIGALRPVDAARLDPADPAAVPLRLFHLLATGDGAALRGELLAEEADAAGADGVGDALLRAVRRGWGADVPPEVVVDAVAGTMEVRVEGEGPLRRVRLAAPGAAPVPLYVAFERGRWRILASGGEVGPLGTRAARLVQAGDLASARRVLAWARDEAGERAWGGTPADVLAALWTQGESAPAAELGVAAAAVQAFGPGAARAIPALEAARASAAEGPRRAALEWALAAAAARAGVWESALAVSDDLLRREPRSTRAFSLRTRALLELGRAGELRRDAERRLRAEPADLDALHALVSVALRDGDAGEVRRQEARIVESGKATAGDWNNMAWAALFLDPVPREALAEARRAVQLSGEREAAYLHTLAAVHASNGEPAQALELLVKAVERSGAEEPAPHDWVVVGRIAEEYGLADEAAAAYRRVVSRRDAEATDSHHLAEARLARLAAAARR